MITEPGLYELSDAEYHADPVEGGSVSSTVLRSILPPGSPAKVRHLLDHEQEAKDYFDVGTAAHGEVLGNGRELVVVDADSWQTKAARAARDEARTAGKVPLLPEQAQQVKDMAAAVRRHPTAGQLLAPGSFTAEHTAVWRDSETGLMCRAKWDAVTHFARGGRLRIIDLKTTGGDDGAAPAAVESSVGKYTYHQQGDHYVAGAAALDLTTRDQIEFWFVFVEKTPPHLVTAGRLKPTALEWGRIANRKALHVYAECVRTDRWPGHADDQPVEIDLPYWAEAAHERAWRAGAYDVHPDAIGALA